MARKELPGIQDWLPNSQEKFDETTDMFQPWSPKLWKRGKRPLLSIFSTAFQDSQSRAEVFATESVQTNSIAVAENGYCYWVLAKKCKGCHEA